MYNSDALCHQCKNGYLIILKKGWVSMKKTMKRSLALGALMAFVITGSAMAGSTKILDRDGKTHDYLENVHVTSYVVTTKESGKVVGVIGAYVDKESVANIEGNIASLNLEHDLTVYGFRTNSKGVVNFGNSSVIDSVDIIVKSSNGYSYGIVAMDKGSKININTKVFNVEVIDHKTGYPSSFAVLAQGGDDFPEGLGEMAPTININAENINITSTGNGIGAFSNGQVDINGNLVVNALHAIDTRGNSTINVNTDGKHTTVLNGDIVFETPATPENSHSSGSIINSYVNVNLNGEDSSWTGRAYQYYTNNDQPIESVELVAEPFYGNVTGFKLDIANGASWNVTGDSFANTVNLKEGGSVNISDKVSEMNVTEVNMTGGTINMNGKEQTMSVNSLIGDEGTINVSNA